MSTSIIGYPRVGKLRELKFATEQFFRKELSENGLLATAKKLRAEHWNKQAEQNITFIPSNDFSFYDTTLDTACLLNIVPKRYKALNLSPLNEYFAQARGYQGQEGDVHALPMKKWFNTNYHYLVPEIELDTEIKLVGTKPFDEYQEAKSQNIETRPVILGPFTLLKLTKLPQGKSIEDYQNAILDAYQAIFDKFNALGAQWIQIDEPSLVTDLTEKEVLIFEKLYRQLLTKKGSLNVLLQTYFGDIRDCYQTVTCLPFDGIGLDFVEGKQTLALVKKYGFPAESTLFAGLINGKNIWKNHYEKTLTQFFELKKLAPKIVLNTSCSLLHVPYTLDNETKLTAEHKSRFAFAQEKLLELSELNQLIEAKEYQTHPLFTQNQTLFAKQRGGEDKGVQQRVASLTEKDFIRLPEFAQREAVQHKKFNLPLLPTTTIGSFPQTAEVRQNRALYKKGEKTLEQYIDFNKQAIADCIKLQEEIGIDVLVHGEFERNDMVEYFGESLNGFIFTEKAWVQSYGTRCVKPPIIWGDVSRSQPITVEWSSYAQSLTSKPVKGMLTGPVTILNWSFPREDISIQESVYQIGLAISDEVIDLEKAGINIIQIDEAALKEKLPLRREDWHSEYLDWAIPSFRLVHSRVKPETQIHTHMCYSEFAEIITDIDAMDADVISFEASRSSLELINTLQEKKFKTEVGPGVYDIHSPRIPSVDELVKTIKTLLNHIQKEKLWINPDCGLKTRGEKEVVASLKNLVTATKQVRSTL